MRVRLNAYRHDGGRPGDVVDLEAGEAAGLLALGGAYQVLDEVPEHLVRAGVVVRQEAEVAFGVDPGE
jgi:hypothetical protein